MRTLSKIGSWGLTFLAANVIGACAAGAVFCAGMVLGIGESHPQVLAGCCQVALVLVAGAVMCQGRIE